MLRLHVSLRRPQTKACVIFDSRYGNTAKVGRSLSKGLNEAGIETACVNVRDATFEYLEQCGLICVGAPTETYSASKPMKQFLKTLRDVKLSGKYGFAFDTKVDSRLSGSAAKFIEKELGRLGLQLILRREYAYVDVTKGKGASLGARLKDGEEARFEKIGTKIGEAVLAAGSGNANA